MSKELKKFDTTIICNQHCVQIGEHNDFLIKNNNFENIIIYDNVNSIYLCWQEFLNLKENKNNLNPEKFAKNNLRRLKWKVYLPIKYIKKGKKWN